MDFLIATIVDAVSISVLNRNNLAQGDSPAQTFADDEKLGGINLMARPSLRGGSGSRGIHCQ